MCSSRFAGRALAVVLAVSVGLVLAACASNPGTVAAPPDGSSSDPKRTGEWPSMPNDDASLELTGTPETAGTLRGYLVGTSVRSVQQPGAADSETYRVSIRWGDTDANSMTDMTLSDGTEVSIDGKLIADATAAGKRVALDQAISGAEAAGAACRALVVYGPGPVATGGDAPSYPVPILSRIDVSSP